MTSIYEGKSVIRPIAFKPLGGRLSAGGERYGSTPVLASRPPSLMTLYGSSSDVREARWCGSPQPASLSALPPGPIHQRHHSAIMTKSSSVLGETKEPAPAPSPADSGVSELERDHHDYSAGERSRRPRLLQSYRRDERELELSRLRRDRALLRQRLEDTEWSLCQRAGEISLLKTQLKDAQNEQTARGHEYLTLKADCRQLREALDKRDKEVVIMRAEADERDETARRLQAEVDRLTGELTSGVAELTKTRESGRKEIDKLKTEVEELRQELSEVSLGGYEGVECGRTTRGIYDLRNEHEYHWSARDSALEDAEVQRLNGEAPEPWTPAAGAGALRALRRRLRDEEERFHRERTSWTHEKDKVLTYQRRLQADYVQVCRRARALEAERDALRLRGRTRPERTPVEP